MKDKMRTFQIWLENRNHLMNVEGKNETDARERFNDLIWIREEEE